ncbi:MAG: bifunctional folylpolyglutamate synthase/dihydrofolate synthase [Acidobacteriota bacterium]
MNYPDCLTYLNRLGNEVLTMRFGLGTVRTLLQALGNPHLKYPAVLVTGTNGKGSVARFLHSIAHSSGLHAALYTSPHLVALEERFISGGRKIHPEAFASCFSRVVEGIARLSLPAHPTYFETLTATAFLYFAEQEVELAVLEIGMGGRLDSTNVVDPLLSIITPVGLDHQKYLGETLEAIAREKAGIIHPNRPVVIAPQKREVREVLLEESARKNSKLTELNPLEVEILGNEEGRYSFSFHGQPYNLPVYGRNQVENAALAILAAEILGASLGAPTVAPTNLQGVLQKIGRDPDIFLDGAHNLDAACNLVSFLSEHTASPRSLVIGLMHDKDLPGMSAILSPCFDRIYLTEIDSPRAASVDELKQVFPQGTPIEQPLDALQKAVTDGSQTIVVSGSFYLVGKILSGIPVS